jgi:hypothetical protein
MSDEVTKKDLQSLQGYINKKIAELDKKIDELTSVSRKDSDELDGIIVRVRQDLEKRMDRADARVTDAVNALAKAIADVAKKSNS